MSRLLSTLIAGTFAIASTVAVGDGLVNPQKQTQLDRIIAYGNTNAPAEGKAITEVARASARDAKALQGGTAHQQALDRIIATGQSNAPLRGRGIVDLARATAHDPPALPDSAAHRRALDEMIATGNRNGGG